MKADDHFHHYTYGDFADEPCVPVQIGEVNAQIDRLTARLGNCEQAELAIADESHRSMERIAILELEVALLRGRLLGVEVGARR